MKNRQIFHAYRAENRIKMEILAFLILFDVLISMNTKDEIFNSLVKPSNYNNPGFHSIEFIFAMNIQHLMDSTEYATKLKLT